MTSETVIGCLRESFCTHGVLDVVVSDSDRDFISTEFQKVTIISAYVTNDVCINVTNVFFFKTIEF